MRVSLGKRNRGGPGEKKMTERMEQWPHKTHKLVTGILRANTEKKKKQTKEGYDFYLCDVRHLISICQIPSPSTHPSPLCAYQTIIPIIIPVCLFIYLFICLSIYLSICLSINLRICISMLDQGFLEKYSTKDVI